MHGNKTSPRRPHAAAPPRRPPRWWPWLVAAPAVACLTAACTSAAATVTSTTAASESASPKSAASGASAMAGMVNCAPPGTKQSPCYSPQAYQVAYGTAPLLARGIDGSGETVVMPELAQTPSSGGTDIRKDLAAFDKTFGLPAAKLNVITTVARSATPYLANGEEVTDTEMVHAIAPGAVLDVVLVPAGATSSSADFAAAITKVIQQGAALHAAVVSVSASAGEHFLTRAEVTAMNAALEQARGQHVTVVAAAGDDGAISSHPAGPPVEVSMPASDPLVLGVGGTELDAAPAGTFQGEMAWNGGDDASGGGYSSLFPRPSYQNGVARAGAGRAGSGRGVPDVAANAYSGTAMAEEFGDGELRAATGTSASTPLWAAVIALADQAAGHPLGFVNPALYAVARSPAYHQAFHDVVTGDNSVLSPSGVFIGYNAGPGWDPVTGWGSPDARYLVPLLAH